MTKSVEIKDLEKQAEIVENLVAESEWEDETGNRELAWAFVAFLNDTTEELAKYGNVTLVGMSNE
jgi:hypothetical protein